MLFRLEAIGNLSIQVKTCAVVFIVESPKIERLEKFTS